MLNYKRLIIADDLTGANDTGIHFLSAGKSVGVVTDPDGLLPENAADTLVINTNTRMLSCMEAYETVLRTVKKFSLDKDIEIYKKIDSTLRGNIGAEIDAFMDGMDYDLVCVAPASPRNGRKVVSGLCYINDELLENSEIASDPFTPVEISDIKKIVSLQTDRKIAGLKLDQIRQSVEQARTDVLSMASHGVEIIVADSETVDDLKKVRTIFSNIDKKILFVGAAGFYHAIAKEADKPVTEKLPGLDRNFKFLFVIGSLMETTLNQIEWLKNKAKISTVIVSTKKALTEPQNEVSHAAERVISCMENENTIILRTEKKPLSSDLLFDSGKIGYVIGESVKMILNGTEIGVFLFSGGDTALHILKQLNINYLQLIDEALPGIPVAVAGIPQTNREVIIMTKAGSYGDEDAFEKILEYLSKRTMETN